jgi:hypothetical protein
LLVLYSAVGLALHRLLLLLLLRALLPLLPLVLLPRLLLLAGLLLGAGLLRRFLGNRLWNRFLLRSFVLDFCLDHARMLNIPVNLNIYPLKINALRIPAVLVIFSFLRETL